VDIVFLGSYSFSSLRTSNPTVACSIHAGRANLKHGARANLGQAPSAAEKTNERPGTTWRDHKGSKTRPEGCLGGSASPARPAAAKPMTACHGARTGGPHAGAGDRPLSTLSRQGMFRYATHSSRLRLHRRQPPRLRHVGGFGLGPWRRLPPDGSLWRTARPGNIFRVRRRGSHTPKKMPSFPIFDCHEKHAIISDSEGFGGWLRSER